MINLKNKIVLVTGGNRGIGKATVLQLAQNQATVIFTYHKHQAEAKTTTAAARKYANCLSLQVDLANPEEITKLFAFVKQKYRRLDILVNNAGIMQRGLMLMTKAEDLNTQIDVNLKGVYLCMQAAIKLMLTRKSGKIINLASIVGEKGDKGLTAYAATKGAIAALTKSAAKEVGLLGITVNAIAPGFIDTHMNQSLATSQTSQLIGSISLGRLGKPADVAKVILFLASNLSDYVSGAIIPVDGGMVM